MVRLYITSRVGKYSDEWAAFTSREEVGVRPPLFTHPNIRVVITWALDHQDEILAQTADAYAAG